MKIKSQHFPPEHCGWCEDFCNKETCKRPPKTYHLVDHCNYEQCVEGWWDYFDMDMTYLMSKPCPVCLPDTWDYVEQYPVSASKLDKKGWRNGRSLGTQRKMQEMRSKKITISMPEQVRGKKK
jgi:hypothetical protein